MKKLTEEAKAIAFLEKKGYKVAKPLPAITYGMVVYSKTDDVTIVITVFDRESNIYKWGGTVIGDAPGGTDMLWVNLSLWDKNEEYTVLGSVDLSKWIGYTHKP